MLDTHEDKLRTTAVHTDDHQPLIQIRDLMAMYIRVETPDANTRIEKRRRHSIMVSGNLGGRGTGVYLTSSRQSGIMSVFSLHTRDN